MCGTGISPRQTSSEQGGCAGFARPWQVRGEGSVPGSLFHRRAQGDVQGSTDMDTRYRSRSLMSLMPEGPVRLLKSQNQWHVPRSKYFRVTRRQVTFQPLFQIREGTQEAGLLGSVQREGRWVTGRWGVCRWTCSQLPTPPPPRLLLQRSGHADTWLLGPFRKEPYCWHDRLLPQE